MKLSSILNLSIPAMSKPELFKSRKFWLAIIEIVVGAIIAIRPEFEPVRIELIAVSAVVVSLAIGGFALEDIAIAFKTGERNPKYTETPPVA